MKIKGNKSYGIVSTDVIDINNKEMSQMHELKKRIEDVLNSHKPDSKERRYVSDDDLKLMHAVLSVFTKEYEPTQTSAFDDFLKEQATEKPDEKTEDVDNHEIDDDSKNE